MATNSEMQTEFAFFGEVWQLFKKFYNVEDNDLYWENLVSEASEIDKKFNCRLCRNLLLSILDELDFRSRYGRARSLNDKLYQNECDPGG